MVASTVSSSVKLLQKAIMNSENELTLFAELKPRLSIVHAVLNVPQESYERGTTIKVLKSHIEVTRKCKEQAEDSYETNTIVLQNVSLIPASCHGLKWVPGDGMHFRMQICSQEDSTDDISPMRMKSLTTEEQLTPYKGHPIITCKMCGETILNKRFSRVRLLPSANWHEFADQMYCHPHQDDVPNEEILSPKQGDCLVGEHTVVVLPEDISTKGAMWGAKNTLHCQRCKIVIELGKASCVHLSKHYLDVTSGESVEEPTDKPSRMARIQAWFTDFLLTESTTHSSCRILIESEHESSKETPYILMWVLESNVVLYSGGAANQQKADLHLHPQPILKVLYRDCVREKNKAFGKQWREDFTVHSVSLPHDLCKQLLLMLVESSKLLPRSLQSANGFYVGFLRKRERP